MAKQIRTDIVLNGQDRLSNVTSEAVKRSLDSIHKLEAGANKSADRAFKVGRDFGVAGAAIAAPLVIAGKEAVDFEKKIAAVGKVSGFQIGSTDFAEVSEQAKDLSVYLGRDAEAAAGLYEELAGGGVALKDLSNVGVIAGEIGVAFDKTAEEAGSAFIKMGNALGTAIDETKLVADAINHLSDGTASKAGEILTFMSNGGAAVSRGFNVASTDVAAFGATLISMGTDAAKSTTIVERMMKGIFNSEAMRKDFLKAGGGMEGVTAVLDKGVKIKDANKQFEYFKAFGEYGTDIQNVAKGMRGPGGLISSLDMVSDRTIYAGSVHREFNSQQQTAQVMIGQTTAAYKRLALDLGTGLLPIIKDLSTNLLPVAKNTASWMKENPELTATLTKVALGASAVSFAISGAAFAYGGLAKGVVTATRAMKFLAGTQAGLTVIESLSTNARLFQMLRTEALLAAAPIAAVAASVVAVGVALAYAYEKVAPFHHAMDRLFTGFDAFFDHAPDALGALFSGDFKRLKAISNAADLQAEINADDSRRTWNAEQGIKEGSSRSVLPNIFGVDRKGYGGQKTLGGGEFNPVSAKPDGGILAPNPRAGGAASIIQNITFQGAGALSPADQRNYEGLLKNANRDLLRMQKDNDRFKSRISYQ